MQYIVFFIVVVILLIYMPIYINVKVIRKNNNDNIELKFFFLKGLIKRSLEIPFVDIINSSDGMSVEVKNKIEKGNKEKDVSKGKKIISFNKIIDKIEQMSRFKDILIKINNYLFDKIEVKKFHWVTEIGLENAAITGVISGSLWTIKSLIISFITNKKVIKEINIDITPKFNSNVFETSLDCIIKFKIVYIIIAGIKGIKGIVLKKKGGK